MPAFAQRANLYIGSITAAAGTSGTLIGEVEADTHEFVVPRRTRLYATGRAPADVKAFYLGARLPVLKLRLRDVAAASIGLLLSELANGSGGVKGSGTSVTTALAAATTRAIILRPLDTAQRYLYMPTAAIAPSSPDLSIFYSSDRDVFSGQEVHLVPTRAAGNNEPPWAWDSSSNIDALYAGLG